MPTELFASDRATTAVTSGGTTAPSSGTVETWTVASSAMFGAAVANVSQFHVADPAAPSEVIAVTAVSGTTWTVTRGAESTTPVAHAVGFTVYQVATSGFLSGVAAVAAGLFSPLAYGAVGNGVADDTVALQNCVAAAAAAFGGAGIVNLGHYRFKTSSPINITGGLTFQGSAPGGGGAIVNSATDIFTTASSAYNVAFNNCTFTSSAGGGHIWNASGSLLGNWTISGCYINQNNAAKSIWYQDKGAMINLLADNNRMTCSGSATVSAWTMINIAGAANVLKFSDGVCTSGNGATAPFFLIDAGYSSHTDTNVGMTASSPDVTDAGAVTEDVGLYIYSANFPGGSAVINSITSSPTGYVVNKNATATLSGQTCLIGNRYGPNEDVIFDNITWEVCAGGAVAITSVYDVLINECSNWDIAHGGLKANFYSFTKGNNTLTCQNIKVRGGLAGGPSTTGSGFNDFYADSTCLNVYLDSFGYQGTLPAISSPAAQTTITNPAVAYSGAWPPPVTTFPGPVAVTGTTGASAGGRYVGATVSGHPTTGTFLAGDFCNDQAGNLWLFNGATWSSGTPIPPDIQFFTATGVPTANWSKPAGAKTVVVTLLSGGPGGGSGRRGAAGTVRCGGGGSGAGAMLSRTFDAGDLPSSVAVTVGAAGAGGAAVTTDDTSGNSGSAAGTNTTFGTLLSALPGGIGLGGTATLGTGGVGPLGGSVGTNGAGASASTTGLAGNTINLGIVGPPGGPSGGGITSGDVAGAGAAGAPAALGGSSGVAGAGGAVDSTPPTSGTAPTAKGSPGPSAGSGAASKTTAAQKGADALANTGAGGAGGGASLNGNNSGAGGNGGSGWVLVITYFQ